MAQNQRDKDIIKTQPILLDPIFELPPDLDEGGYRLRDKGDNTDDVSDGGTGLAPDAATMPTEAEKPVGPGSPTEIPNKPFEVTLSPRPLGAPVEVSVKSQTFRFKDDGTYVVDVVLEFPDQEGANSYEVRLAK